MPALELDAVDVSYGKVAALRGLTLHVDEGEIVAVLGNNGAGKSTTLSTISGLVRPQAGSVRYNGADIAAMDPWDIVAAGVVHVPEGRRLFSTMTVAENLQLGGYLVGDPKLVAERMERVYDLMPRVAERRDQQGGTLSGGEQQMVAIGRAIVAGPKLLMLDEPSMGLAPLVVQAVMEVIADVNAAGTTVLLVEQNARAALRIAHRAYVIDTGTQTIEGPAGDLAKDPRIVEAYLGA
jgi:branched-chain amino acid transport system ATP-binding protein